MIKNKIVSIIFFLLCFVEVFSQDWSYRIGPDTLKNKSYYAYLWVPSSANSGIRGLIMAPQISSEWQFVRSTEIRKVAEKQKLAIVYFYPSQISIMNAQDTLYLQNTLDQFAEISGFQEISHAPWFLFGHSTGCLFAMHLAYWKPERTIGVICYKGGIVPNPKWFPGSINNVPVMGVQGEFEEYDNTQEVNATDHSAVAVRRDVLNYRKASPDKNLFSATILPGEGHMVWTKNGIGIIAEFIEKAARYRIPKDASATGKPVELNTLNLQDGWAAKGDPHTNIEGVKIGAMKNFKNQDSCYWFFDKQFAKHWLALEQDTRKERQFVCPPSEPPILAPSPFKPLVFQPNGKIYETQILMDSKIHISGSSSSGLPVEVIYQTGPGFIENGILRANPANIIDELGIRVGLRQNGSEKYRIADRLIKIRLIKIEGKEQKVIFGAIPKTLFPGDKVEIDISSTSGLPVTLCVNAGPAVLNGNVLHVKSFTSKSGKAWIILRAGQEGNKEFATADPAEITIEVEKKIWDTSTYPDETGFRQRMEGMLPKIAAKEFGQRSLAVSNCPDTGLPVKVWAVEGEEIISPYTGRKYIQGPTGYFGPKTRNDKGEILSFGGDPLKYDLPPATATLLLNPDDQRAKAFLSIPGNLRQQYHFACKNWARFYPLLSDKMGERWKSEFMKYVAEYTEGRRPSDGPDRELKPLANAHNLAGQPGYLLGGNPLDGGTENHKTMWRTSALLYSQLFPDTAKISGYPVKEAEKLTKEMLRDYLKRLLIIGNGEYDSQIYYPHSIEGFLNLYDFSPDEETRLLAKFALDYYFVTYGLKVIDGGIAGAQKRGYLTGASSSEMETMLWAFFNNTSRKMEGESVTIQQATTSYRPNQVIWNIVNKKLKFPFEAKMSRPFYHMDHPHAFAETYYCSDNYAMGNIQMTIVDNPNQQMVWSVVTTGENMPLCFSGGQPLRGSTSGHSPYTQTLQSKGTLMLMTAPTKNISNTDTLLAPNYSKAKRDNLWLLPESEQGRNYETRNRMKYASKELHPVQKPKSESDEEIERFWNESKGSASSWFYFPHQLVPKEIDGNFFFETIDMFLAIIPLAKGAYIFNPGTNTKSQKFFADYGLVVIPGNISGYIIETSEKSAYRNLQDFSQAIRQKTKLDDSKLNSSLEIHYLTLNGDKMNMGYNPEGLRCRAEINGQTQNWDKFTKGAIYDSPYLKIRDGIMKVSDGRAGYEIDFRGDVPLFKELRVLE